MSGLEVAGVVLGAFPLLISVLEHYREASELATDWWKVKRVYKRCKDDLKFYRLFYEGTIEKLLLPLIVNNEELELLLGNPMGPKWKDPALEIQLKERLGKSYELYLETIKDINMSVQDIQEHMGLDDALFKSQLSSVSCTCLVFSYDDRLTHLTVHQRGRKGGIMARRTLLHQGKHRIPEKALKAELRKA